MNSFSSLFKKQNMGELLLTILFIVYLIMGYRTPQGIADLVDTLLGKIVIFIIVIYLFINHNSILAVLSLFVAFNLIKNSSYTGINSLQSFIPSEEKKSSQFYAFNQFPYTLEQEIVKKMAPIIRSGSTLTKPSFKPVLGNTYDAKYISNC